MSGIQKAVRIMNASGLSVRTWNDAPISRRDSDGYANATAMCQANGKRWNDYQRLDRTQEYLRALEAVTGNPATGAQAPLIEMTQGGPPHLQGTWIHPRIAVDLARWLNPAFAVWMDGWLLEQLEQPASAATQPLDMGVKVMAPNPRYAVDVWREAVKREVISALNRSLGTGGIPANASPSSYPIMANCDWVQSPCALDIDQVRSVLPADRPVTSFDVLTALGLEYNRTNQMAVGSVLRHFGYLKQRRVCQGHKQWTYFPTASQLHFSVR
jgi:hypothetical protein